MSITLRSSCNRTFDVIKATANFLLLRDQISGLTFQLFHQLFSQRQYDLYATYDDGTPARSFGKIPYTQFQKAWLEAIKEKEFFLIEFEEFVGEVAFTSKTLCCANSLNAACKAVDLEMPTLRGRGEYNIELDAWEYGSLSLSVASVTVTDKQTAIAAIRTRIATLMLWVD